MLKRITSLAMSLVLSLSYLVVLTPNMAGAALDTCTWTGMGGNDQFNTPANWSCSVDTLENGDALVFNANTVDFASSTPNNDLGGITFSSITFIEDTTNNDHPHITGLPFALSGDVTGYSIDIDIDNDITLTSNVTVSDVTLNGDVNLAANTLFIDSVWLEGVISGTGGITNSGGYSYLKGDNTYSGATLLTAGNLFACTSTALGASSSGTTVTNGATLQIWRADGVTIAEPLTLNGEGSNSSSLLVGQCGGSGGAGGVFALTTPTKKTTTYSGLLTLNANSKIKNSTYNNYAKFTNVALNGFSLTQTTDSKGTLVVGTTTTSYTKTKKTVTTKTTDSYSLYDGEELTVKGSGEVGGVFVYEGGKLTGDGQVGGLSTASGSNVYPGNSPGCLTVDGDLNMSGSLDAEIAGNTACTQYDQIDVTDDVYLFDADLNVTFLSDFIAKAGDKFTIIKNGSTNAVNGTFRNLAEGATFTANGHVLSVSYKGGDGNDVVLTVKSIPATPDTGFSLAGNTPIATLMTTTLLAGLILASSRKLSVAKIRNK